MTGAESQRKTALAAGSAALAAALLGACSSSGAPGVPGPVSATAASVAPASGCTPDYCAPASWDTALAPTPLAQIKSFSEPINVVLSARSTVSLASLQTAMKARDWSPVSAKTAVNVTGIHMRCISPERADVTGSGYLPMQVAWRLEGCLGGNELSVSGDEGHVRMWHQPVPGSANGAWFIAASYETMCLVEHGALRPAKERRVYAALHPSAAYHCVDGGPGSLTATYPDGYNDGAAAFAADLTRAARARGWHVSTRTVRVKRAASAGEGGVPFNDDVDLLTVTK